MHATYFSVSAQVRGSVGGQGTWLALAILWVLSATTAGCGYFKSGTWEDDPRNYRRAWGVSPPEGLSIVHSWYYRSAHFTREEAYYFEMVGMPEIAEAFAEANGLVVADREALESWFYCFERPEWFAPSDPTHYRAWTSVQGSAIVLQERNSDRTFVHVCQL